MGRKSAVIYASASDEPFLGPSPELDLNATDALALELWPGSMVEKPKYYFDDNQVAPIAEFFSGYECPARHAFTIGVFARGAIYADTDVIPGCIAKEPRSIVGRFLQLFPHGQVLVTTTWASTNIFGYILFKAGKLVRAYGGDGDHDITLDIGSLLPVEVPFFKNSRAVQGKRRFWCIRPGTFGDPCVPVVKALRGNEICDELIALYPELWETGGWQSNTEFYEASAMGFTLVEKMEEAFLGSGEQAIKHLPVRYYLKKEHPKMSGSTGDEELARRVLNLYAEGKSNRAISIELRIDRTRVSTIVREHRNKIQGGT